MNSSHGTVTILHLSDVHFGIRDDSGFQARNANAVVDAMKGWGETIDCIVFSGDLSQRGDFSELQQGQEWLTKLALLLDCRCIIVPGNHEIERIKSEKKILRAARGTEEDFGNWRQEIYQNHPQLKNFLDWHQLWRQDSDIPLANWSTNPAVTLVSEEFNSIPCNIVCINTALLSCDIDDTGALCVDIKALNGLLKDCRQDESLVIVVGHHPTSELASWNKDRIERVLGQGTGPHAYLHGHLHDLKAKTYLTSSGVNLFTSSAGAVFSSADYPKSFSILQFFVRESKIKTTVYALNEDSGSWIVDNAKSGETPARLPKLNPTTANNIKAPNEAAHKSELSIVDNPFSDYSANGISADVIHLLFVERRNSLQNLKIKHDNIVEGQRGTGKTMLLRYFSAEVQNSLLSQRFPANNSIVEVFNDSRTSFGVYCLLNGGGLDRSDFQAIESDVRSKMIFLHLASLFLFSKLLLTLTALIASGRTISISPALRSNICASLRSTNSEDESTVEAFLSDVNRSLKRLRDDAYEHLASSLPGGTSTAFNPWLSLSDSVIPFLSEFKTEMGLREPIFLLIDDFDRLTAAQQSAFFSAASARQRDVVCFKFGSMSEGIKTNTTSDGRRYSEGDDYDYVYLDWVDGGVNNDKQPQYKDALKEISRKRIDNANWPPTISLENLFDNWEAGDKIRTEVKAECLEEFRNLKGPTKNQTFESFWTKQGNSRYFKHLARKKIPHRYAGPSTIVEVSSGIYRQFLEVCGRIVNSAISQGWNPGIENNKTIGVQIQDRCIREWSSGMFKNLDSSGDLTNIGVPGTPVTSENLVNLANSLTQYFRWRLLSNSKDPEVIAISIRDMISPGSFAKILLDVAVRETLLQRRSVDYTNKSGDGRRLPTYQLNRRLVPHVGIGTKMQGRYEITCSQLELAAKNPERFLEAMRKGDGNPAQTSFI